MGVPSKYNDVALNTIKPRPYQQIKYHKDSEIVTKLEENRWKKNNSPSPTSYDADKSMEKTNLNKSGRYYSISKEKKKLYTETIQAKSKKLPGVGQYNSHIAQDKISVPYMRKR